MKLITHIAATLLSCYAMSACADGFSITSATIKEGARLPETHILNGFGCHGGNQSPAIAWKDAPQGTKSFAVTMYDPDAPTGSGWWHWVVYDIPASVNGLPAGAGSPDGKTLPQGAVQGRSDFGSPGYGGACPPAGSQPHRYRITVHALKIEHLDLAADATAAMVGFMLNANSLGSATLQAIYSR